MKKILLLLVGLLAFVSIGAQQRVVKGRVTDRSDGSPIPAVTISTVDKAGLKHGGLTDADGYYNIQIPQESSILTFSFVGMKTVQVKIGNRKVINVVMEEDAVMTEEVVVTALGIKREAKALSYSTQGVDMESINDAKSSNIVSSLSGKIAGVQITPPGMNNGSARIVIRGNNSVTGNNQPLFVVDGMPIDNYDGENGNMDYGNGAADINPDDIENIEVLKGANASALYGSRAANGVILITTKKGGDKLKVDVNSNCMLQTLVEFPEYQNSYGVGTSFYIDNKNNPPLSNTNYRSWGSPMMGQPVIGLDGKLKPYLPEPDNVKDFYQTAATWTNSISVEGGNKKSQYRISYTNVHSSSVVEKFNIDNKSTFNIRLNNQFTNWLSLDSKVSYIDDRVTNRQYSKSDNKNPMNSYVHMARSTSLSELYTWKDANGSEIGTHRNFSNPYWIINENKNKDVKKRIIGAFVLKADIIDGLSLQAKAGIDTYNWNGYAFNNIGAMNDKDGQMQTFQQEMESFNIEGLLTYNKRFKDFSLMANAGLVMYSTKQTRYDQMVNSLLQPGLINISNSAESPKDTQRMSEKKINSLFGAVSLGYKDYLYLDITGRNDWSSTLPPKNNSYFYPSIGTSFIFSEAFKIDKDILSFGKVRASYAMVGSDTNPYRIYDSYSFTDMFNDVKLASLSTTMNNPDLKPEKTYSWEVGADIRFFKNRLGVDFTYYNTSTKNQIINAQLPTSSGYQKRFYNAGEIQNKGVELMVNATPIETKDFTWDINFNWAKNKSEVVSLIDGVDRFQIGNYSSYMYVYAEVGKPYGYMRGLGVKRHKNGKMIMEDGGGLLMKEPDKEFGSYTPDWTAGITNTFHYKDFDLSFLIDIKQGGIIYSASMGKMLTNGMTAETLFGRDEYYIRKEIWGESDTELSGGAWFDAVYEDGTPANKYMSPQSYAYCMPNYAEFTVYDASYVKLRELTLGYTFPKKLINKIKLQRLRLAFVGRNLWTIHKNTPQGFDPEASQTSGNGQGIENGSLPPSATYGFDLKLTF
jgi:TonB-linked SusC/RagA family outer membrane protein